MRAATFKTVSVIDVALDTERITVDEIIKFMDTRDYAIVENKWKPGKMPTIFHCREVPHGLWESFVMLGRNEAEQHAYAFRAGVFKVENLYGDDNVSVGWEPAKPRDGSKSLAMSAEEAERFSPAERAEIGAVVFQHSFLPRRIVCTFPVPSSVRAISAKLDYLHVEASLSTAEATSSDEHSADSAPQMDATETSTGENAAASA